VGSEETVAEGEWQIQEAKARLSTVIDRALNEGPQRITRHGRPVDVVISEHEYRNLTARTGESLVDFLARSPFGDLDLVRNSTDTGREIDF
jgi:prevent-host-death family protein